MLFNYRKTFKLGLQSDQVNLTANNYTAYINITAAHRYEFNQKFGSKLQEQSQLSRGHFFNKYIGYKMNVPDVNIIRIDLVFDNKKMLNLLENRGEAIKNCDYKGVREIEEQIEAFKEYHYHADVVGAFVTYETEEDLKRVLLHFCQ
jgi:hypothetical protein